MSYVAQVDFTECNLTVENVSNAAYSKVGKELFHQLSTVGFVYLKNPGIDKSLQDELIEVTKEFFLCPLEEKLKYKRNIDNNFGYDDLGAEQVDPSRPGDLKEGFNARTSTLSQENCIWPDDLAPGFSSCYKELMQDAIKLANRVLTALSFGMNLNKDDFLTNFHEKFGQSGNCSALRTLYYPKLTMKCKPGQLRCGEHSDYGSLALLFQDNVGGLQVKNTAGEFVDADPVEDCVVVNIGDCLQLQTQGLLKSTKHRVLIPDDVKKQQTVRRSLVLFCQPDDNVIVNRPLRYGPGDQAVQEVESPLTSLQWLQRRYAATY